MRPIVPRPTTAMKVMDQVPVTIRPIGMKARLVPGRMKGTAAAARAVAEAAAWGLMVVAACFAKTPLTNDASWDDRVAVTSWFVEGFRAVNSICGTRSGCRVALVIVSTKLNEVW